METLIALIIVLLIVGGACFYIWKAKKKGHVKCIGCPYAGSCSHSCSSKPNPDNPDNKS